MFENLTFEYLLKRALSNVPSDVDKRQGSVIYDTLAPACAELAQAYIQMEIIMQEAFADTASRDYLVLRAKERGLSPYEATNAILKMEVTYSSDTENVSIGDRFNLNGLNYVVIEQMTDNNGNAAFGLWKVQCETLGTVGNNQFGDLLPLQTIQDLTTAKITALLIPGEEAEDTEAFRQRYFDSINSDAFGGNRADYLQWVKQMDGVGQVKVKRTPEGGGTVGIIITDAEGKPATQTLINEVKEALDPAEYTGQGEGLAPIGHSVTVTTVRIYDTDVNLFNIEYDTNADRSKVDTELQVVLNNYAAEINSSWENKTTIKIYAAQVLARCLDVEGIVNIERADLNGDDYIIVPEKYIVKLTICE